MSDTLENVKSALMQRFGTMGIERLMDVYLAIRADLVESIHPRITEALKSANMRMGTDLNGNSTLFCRQCNRDSGYHYDGCQRAQPFASTPSSKEKL